MKDRHDVLVIAQGAEETTTVFCSQFEYAKTSYYLCFYVLPPPSLSTYLFNPFVISSLEQGLSCVQCLGQWAPHLVDG